MHVRIYIKVLHVAYIQVYRLFRYNSTYVIFQKQNHLLPLPPLKTNGTLLSQCDLAATPPTLAIQSFSVKWSTMDRTATTLRMGSLHVRPRVFMSLSSALRFSRGLPLWIWCATGTGFFTHSPQSIPVTWWPVEAFMFSLSVVTGSGWLLVTVPMASLVTATSTGICYLKCRMFTNRQHPHNNTQFFLHVFCLTCTF